MQFFFVLAWNMTVEAHVGACVHNGGILTLVIRKFCFVLSHQDKCSTSVWALCSYWVWTREADTIFTLGDPATLSKSSYFHCKGASQHHGSRNTL